MIEIIALVMVIMVMVVDTIVFRGLRQRLDACVLDLHNRLEEQHKAIHAIEQAIDLNAKRTSHAEAICVRILGSRAFPGLWAELKAIWADLEKIKRDGDLLAGHLGIEFVNTPQEVVPEKRIIRKVQAEESQP